MRTINKKDFSRLSAVQLATLGECVAVTSYDDVIGHWLPGSAYDGLADAVRDEADKWCAAFVRAGEDGT